MSETPGADPIRWSYVDMEAPAIAELRDALTLAMSSLCLGAGWIEGAESDRISRSGYPEEMMAATKRLIELSRVIDLIRRAIEMAGRILEAREPDRVGEMPYWLARLETAMQKLADWRPPVSETAMTEEPTA